MDEKILARVRALLAKAEATTFPQEAETYTAKAAELIARYGIDEAMLASKRNENEAPIQRVIYCENPYAIDKRSLLWGLARAMRCKGIATRTESGRQSYRMDVFGFAADIERLEIIYTSLLLQMTSQVVRVQPPSWEHGKTYRKSWIAGFISAACKRVEQAEARASADVQREQADSASASVALVLRDRTALVDDAVSEAFPKVRNVRGRAVTGSGYRDGHAAGSRANIGTTGIGSRKVAIR